MYDKKLDKHNDEILTYDVGNKKAIEIADLKFDWNNADLVNKTVSFIGIGKNDSTYSQMFEGEFVYNTLEIPATVKYGGTDSTYQNEDFTVTEVKQVIPTDSDLMGVGCNVYDIVRGVIIPSTVTHIDEAAFLWYPRIEYFETPFIGQYQGTTNDIASPLGSMFSYPAKYYPKSDNVHNADPTKYLTNETDYTASTLFNKPIVYQKTINSVSYSNRNSISRWYPNNTPTDDTIKAYLFPEKLTTVVVTNETKLPDRAFLELKTVTTIVLSDTLTDLNSKSAVSHCEALTSITFPKTAQSIGDEFLSQCSALQSVTLPDGITQIPMGMLSWCTHLVTVEIPATVEIVGSGAFQQCQVLQNIKVFSTDPNTHVITSYSNEKGFALPQDIERIETEAFAQCAAFTSISVATDKLEYIGEGAFKGCSQLNSLTIPFIGMEKGNSGCKEAMLGWIFGGGSINQQYDSTGNIYQAAIPSTLKTLVVTSESVVARGSLSALPGIETIVITPTDTNQVIQEGAFEKNTTLKDLSVPFVGNNRDGNRFGAIFGVDFYTGGYLASAQGHYIPSSLLKIRVTNMLTIRTGAFADLTSVTDVSISNVATYCEEAIFYNNISLTNLELPFAGHQRGEKYEYWWYYHSYQRYNSLGWLFSRTTSSDEYGVTILQAFGDNYTRWVSNKLESITINDETAIGPHVFQGFKSATHITINDDATHGHVSYISEGTMWGCSSLEYLTVPYIGANYNTTGASGRSYTIGWFFGTNNFNNSYVAYQYSNYRIPNNLSNVFVSSTDTAFIKTIPNYALANMTSLESFSTTAPINQLGDHAFYNDVNLDTVTTNNATYQTVGDYAFANCRKVNCLNIDDEHYFIPTTVVNVGAHAFENTAISFVDFSTTARYKFANVGAYAFSGCSKITDISIPGLGGIYTLKSLGEGAFANCDQLVNVSLGENAVSKYLFKNCISLTAVSLNNVTNVVPEGIFYGCKSLTNPELDDVTTEIGRYAFYGCESLTSFDIKSTTTKIGSYAFTNCSGLDYMFMPRNVITIEAEGFYGCNRDKFFFYVLDPESDWSSGWVENWNCDYPVYIYGQADTSVFEFSYVSDLRGYEITAVKSGYNDFFVGTLSLPATYNGVRVVSLAANLLKNQPRVTSVVIPTSVRRICGETQSGGMNSTGALCNGNVITVYFDISVDQAKNPGKYFADDSETEASGADIPLLYGNENNWLTYGFVYYNNYWGYTAASNVPGSTQVPYLKLNGFEYELEPASDYIYYDGNTHTVEIVAVKTKAVVIDQGSIIDDFENDTASRITPYLPVDLFNFSYSNNINAGSNALITVTINTNELSKFNITVMENTDTTTIYYEGSTTNVLVKNKEATTDKLYLGGTGTTKFTIQKKVLTLFPHGENYTISYKDKWNWSTWTNDYVDGLAGTEFVLTGTLTTKSDDAGSYQSHTYNMYPENRTNLGDFTWKKTPKVTLKGTNVTDNFTIVLGAGYDAVEGDKTLKVTIKPLNVTIEWTGGSWANDWADGMEYYYSYYNQMEQNNYYLWPYTGEVIAPTAQARRALVDNDGKPYVGDVENGIVTAINGSDGFGYGIVEQIKPNYQNPVDSWIACTSSATAYLNSTKNYNLVYYNTNTNKWEDVPYNVQTERRDVVVKYAVTKRNLTIKIVDNDYLIGFDDDYWSFDNWPTTNVVTDGLEITGLNPGSKIAGELRTYYIDEQTGVAPDPYYTNYGLYKLHEENGLKTKDNYKYIDWVSKTFPYDINYSSDMDFMIYRDTGQVDSNNNPIYECENDYYNFTLDVTINVKYNEFTPVYYIDGVEKESSGTTVIGGVDGDTYLVIDYPTEGKFHKFTVGASNPGLTLSSDNVHYYYSNQTDYDITYYEFRLLNSEPGYLVGVKLSRKNFIEKYINFAIKVVKSDYKFAEITREYDGTPINPQPTRHPLGATEKYLDGNANEVLYDSLGQASLDSITYTYYKCNSKAQASESNKLSGAPTEIGKYVVHITADGSEFFNPFGEDNTEGWFEFEITKRKIVIEISGVKTYDGSTYVESYTKYNTDTTKILDDHRFVGIISTKSKDPNIYYGTGTHVNEEGQTVNDVYTQYWYWKVPWKVFTISDNADVSSYYDVEIIGKFEIRKRLMTAYNDLLPDAESVESYGAPDPDDPNYSDPNYWDGKYDGLPHSITVIPHNLWTSASVYYTESEILTADQDNENVSWSLVKPTYYNPGEYYVYFKVVAEYYDTYYHYEVVKIEEQTIEYTPGDHEFEYDGQYHAFIVSVQYPLSATVEYSLDATTWTQTPYEFRDYMDNQSPSYVKIYYRISETNFKSVGFDPNLYVNYTITQDGFHTFADTDFSVTNVNTFYSGIPKHIEVTITNALIYNTKIYYSLTLSDDLSDWSETNITLTDYTPNPVKVYFRFVDAKNSNDNKRYKDTYGDIYYGTIYIKQLKFEDPDITIKDYEGDYDGQPHTIEVLGLDSYVNAGYTVEYSTDPNSQVSGSGWQTSPITFKNVSLNAYVIYVKISANNYETKYLQGSVKIKTKQLAGVIDDGNTKNTPFKIQYTAEPVLDSAIPVNTLNDDNTITKGMIHDGKKTYTFYTASKAGDYDDITGDWIEYDYYEEDDLISRPTKLGVYYVKITYNTTDNCTGKNGIMIVEGFIEITAREVTVTYYKSQQYTGKALSPGFTVSTGTKDVVTLNVKLVTPAGLTPNEVVEIGDYYYTLSINGDTSLYVLPEELQGLILFQITKRKIVIHVEESHIYSYNSQTDTGTPWHRNSGWDKWINGSFLTGHTLELDMETISYARNTYVYPYEEGSQNAVLLNYLDVTAYDDNNIKYSVLDYYDIDLTAVIKIVFKTKSYNFPDKEVFYDGELHGLSLSIADDEIVNPVITFTVQKDYEELEDKSLADWSLYSPTYSEVGKYTIYVRIISDNLEIIYTKARLIIKQTKLEISIDTFDVIYDGLEHGVTAKVTNLTSTIADSLQPDSIKYYPATSFTKAQIVNAYKKDSYTQIDSTIYNKGLNKCINAGTYYVAVAYRENEDWVYSYKIEEVTIKQKDVQVQLASNNITNSKDYDGKVMYQYLKNAIINTADLIPGHTAKSGSDLKKYRIKTNSANVKWGVVDDIEVVVAYEGNDFEFADLNLIIDEENSNADVTKNYHPVITTGISFIIKPISFTFDVAAYTKKTYATTQTDEGWEAVLVSPDMVLPDQVNPNYLFDNQVHFKYYAVDDNDNPVGEPLGIDNQYNVGRYYVIVTFDKGTNFKAYTDEDKAGIVEITPMVVEVEWDGLIVDFTGAPQKPTATYEDGFETVHGLDISIIVYEDNNPVSKPQVTPAGTYSVIASFMSNDNLYGNYQLDTYSSSRLFTINKLVFTYEVDEVTYNTQKVWSKEIHKTDFENFPSNLNLVGSDSDTATLSTPSYAEDIYYGGDLVWDYKVLKGTDDLTDSIELVAVGKVIIYSETITYTKQDVVVPYDKEYHTVLEGLVVTNPADPNMYEVLVKKGTEASYASKPDDDGYKFKDVGSHEVAFKIISKVQGSEQEAEGTITITITQIASDATVYGSLDKTYDAIPVSASTIKVTGSYNKHPNGVLIYTYYRTDSSYNNPILVSTTDPTNATYYSATGPRDVGYYIVKITNTSDDIADTDDYIKNYTKLELSKTFEIRSRDITYVYDGDQVVLNDTLASNFANYGNITPSILQSATWTYQPDAIVGSVDLANGDELHIELQSNNNIGGSNPLVIGKYEIVQALDYTYVGSDTKTPKAQNFYTGNYFAVKWWVLSNTRKEADNVTKLNVSSNYNFTLDFSLDIHYPDIEHTINAPTDVAYDSNTYHSATITFGSSVITVSPYTVTQSYSHILIDSGNAKNNISNMAFKDPGVYRVAYTLSASGYRTYNGTYDISIKYSARTLVATFEAGLNDYNKLYDGENVTIDDIVGKIGANLNWSNVFVSGAYPDSFSDDDVTIEFRKENTSTVTNSIKNVGKYYFTITVPKSTHYSETVIEGIYEIKPGEILVRNINDTDNYVAPFTGSYAYYTLTQTDPYYEMTLNSNPIPAGFTFSGLLQTSGSAVGTYLATATEIIPVTNYVISGGNTNYHVTLEITMAIEAGQMVASTSNITKAYEKNPDTGSGVIRYPTVTMITPSSGTFMYALYVDESTTPEATLPWQTEPIGRGEVGTSIVKIKVSAANYKDKILTSTITITKAQTTMTIPDLTRTYNGQFVSLPANIDTNTDVLRDNWTIWYEKFEGGVWTNMANDIPIDVGTYRVHVEIAENASSLYSGIEATRTFNINQKTVKVEWTNTEFTYDGVVHIPTATLNTGLVDSNNNPIAPTFSVNVTDSSNNTVSEPTIAGLYTATVSISDNVNWKFEADEMSCLYSIKKRTVTLYLNKNGMIYNGLKPEFAYIGEYEKIGSDEYYYVNDVTNTIAPTDTTTYYYSTNIARYKIAGQNRGDYFDYLSILTTLLADVGDYNSLNGDINGLEWKNDFQILNYQDEDVTSSYIIKYDIQYKIDYDAIIYTANSYEVTYDGLPHSLEITVQNAGTPTIKFWDGSAYTINYNEVSEGYNSFTNVKRVGGVVTPYEVKFQITIDNHTPITDSRTITINPKEANLYLKNGKLLDKDYDGYNIDLKSLYKKTDSLDTVDFGYTDMATYRRDITVKFEKKQADNTYIVVTDTSDVGEYKVTATLDEGNDDNYNGGTWTKDVIIKKRKITVTKLDNNNNIAQVDKQYDGLSLKLTKDGTKNEFVVQNLVYGHKFTGIVKTKYAYVKLYNDNSDFEWVNGYSITKTVTVGNVETEVDVSNNYVIEFALKVNITTANMTVTVVNLDTKEINNELVTAVFGTVGGNKKYSINLQVVGPLVYNITYQVDDDPQVLFSNPQFANQGQHTVKYTVSADNYETFVGEAIVIVEGLDANGGYVDYLPQMTFNNNPYMALTANLRPKYISDTQGVQTVTYFDENKNYIGAGDAYRPTNAGTYYFSIYVDEWGDYKSVSTSKYIFTIDPITREVQYENYEVTYNGQVQTPTAYILAYDNLTHLPLVVNSGQTITNVTGYDITADFAANDPNVPNYILTNTSKANFFKIYPIEVEKPAISTTMEFTYSETYTLYDVDGNPVCEKDGNNKDIYNLVTEPFSNNYRYYVYDDNEGKYVEAVGITEFEENVLYYLPQFKVFRFGDEVVVKNTDGNIFIINEDGTIIGIMDKDDNNTTYDAPEQAGLYKVVVSTDRNSDQVANMSNIKHQITVSLLDDVNYVWKDTNYDDYLANDYDDEYNVPFKINPFDIDTNNKEGLKIEVVSDAKYYIMDINPTIKNKPDATVKLLTSDGLFIRNITSGRISGYEAYLVDSDNIVASSDDYNVPGKITAQGMKNIMFDVTGEYEKRATPPVLFEMKANTIRRFIEIKIDGNNSFTKSLGENEIGVTRESTDSSIYLGRIHQNTKIVDILKDFKNDNSLMEVYDQNGVLVSPSQYSTKNFGTGFKIVLYSDSEHQNKIDEITGIVFGDLTGDGIINGIDALTAKNMVAGKVEFEGNEISYMAGAIKTSKGLNGVSTLYIMNLVSKSVDFNSDYQITPEELFA